MQLTRSKYKRIFGILVVFALIDYHWIVPANQTYAKEYLDESIVLSASTYATCRLINGGVSSLQESTITVTPFGVGIGVAAGQILDPINDAVERLSELCVHSMALLGAQRIVLEVINRYGVISFYVILILFLGLALIGKGSRLARFFGRLALILLLFRVATPFLCLLGTMLNQQYFDPRIQICKSKLTQVGSIAMSEFETEAPEVSSSFDGQSGGFSLWPDFMRTSLRKVAQYFEWMKERAVALKEAMRYLKENFAEIMDAMTDLFVLILEKILLLVLVLPIGFLYCLRQLYRWLADEELDHWISGLFNDSSIEPKKTK